MNLPAVMMGLGCGGAGFASGFLIGYRGNV